MEIKWRGDRAVQFQNRFFEGWVNPDKNQFEDAVKASLVAFHASKDEISVGPGAKAKVFSWAGEYEVAGVPFVGVESSKGEVSYTFSFQEGNVTVLGDMEDVPSDDFLDRLGETHCLVVSLSPTGLSAKKMFLLVEKMEPLVLIPLFDDEKLLKAFLSEADITVSSEPESKYVLKKMSSENEDQSMQVVVLKKS